MTVNRPKDALFDQLALVGKALASPKRLELMDVLAQGERSVEALAKATALKLTTASAHLQTLRQGGLVSSRKDGTRIFYRLSSEQVARLYVTVRDVAIENLAETERAARDFLGTDEVESVGREDLVDRLRDGDVVLIDVRPHVEYEASHIDGAISVPLDELCERIRELPAEVEVVAYCRGKYCVLAYEAVRRLREAGRSARRLDGGMIEWRLEHKPAAAGSG